MRMSRLLLPGILILLIIIGLRVIVAQPSAVDGVFRPAASLIRGTWSAQTKGPQVAPKPRQVRRPALRPGESVRSVIRPDDTEIELVQVSSGPLAGVPVDAVVAMNQLVDAATAVVVVRAERVDGRLTAREDWVESTVEVDVVEVLKDNSTKQLKPGSRILLAVDGGEVLVDGKTVRALMENRRAFSPGRSYLFFLGESGGQLHPFPPFATFELSDGAVMRMESEPGREIDFDKNLDSNVFLDAARLAARTRLPQR